MNSKLWFLLTSYLLIVVILVICSYYFIKVKSSNKLKKRICKFTSD